MQLSIRDLEDDLDRGSIWCLNTTEQAGKRSQLLFVVPKIHGQGLDVVEVPMTFIPIDLTLQVNKKQLLESSEFRRTVASSLIVLVDDTEAGLRMKKAGVKEEIERLRNLKTKTKDVTINPLNAPEATNKAGTETTQILGTTSLPVKQIVLTAQNTEEGEVSETQVVNSIRNMGTLQGEDYQYLIEHLGAEFPMVQKYCYYKLKRLTSAQV